MVRINSDGTELIWLNVNMGIKIMQGFKCRIYNIFKFRSGFKFGFKFRFDIQKLIYIINLYILEKYRKGWCSWERSKRAFSYVSGVEFNLITIIKLKIIAIKL